MPYHTSCGVFGFGKSDETTCVGNEDTHLSECDGFLGLWMGSTILKCPRTPEVDDLPLEVRPPPTVDVSADTPPPQPVVSVPPSQNTIGTTYCTQSNSVMWSRRGEDIYATTGLHIPASVTDPYNHSNMNGTREECEVSCDQLETCQGFSFNPIVEKCWFKRTGDLSIVDASDKYDFVYKCPE